MQKPIEVTQLDIAFGGKAMKILPAYSSIPSEFKKDSNKWSQLVSKWFFGGLNKSEWPKAKDGINWNLAMLNIQACLSCFEPKHEHKIAGAAYLASQWFE
ncbi:hypothetical protein 7AX3_73 [uncultured Caudovirales phage]|uniref:Uncharacterized protein n=1 Tax=uncultured Caudovirales phage TaxID=2100421 RepID=A0A2H4JCG5_9CAUD|nr:hypothetical protein [Pantoea sp. MT58]ASN68815.1 hypothetical protein 7AX3_73 [uncultured Caudovirales phage]ASN72920.1 hypothetical protein 7F1_3 [uncultured Caudovirales phage]QNQ59750.1 hypothetical protein IAI47_05755 [Pantoea sp. MT58]